MKRTIYLFSLFLAACAPVASVPVAVATPTTSPIPGMTSTATITPTETPQPTLPAVVEEKFKEAEIEISKIQGASIDNNGLHIQTSQTDDGNASIVVDFTIEQLKDSTVEGDKLIIYDENERKWVLSQDLLLKTYFETELQIMANEEKLSISPQELSGYKISSVSQLNKQLVIYRDGSNNGMLTYNLLTGEIKDLPSAGIIELDLVSGEKWELRYFNDTQKAIDYCTESGAHLHSSVILTQYLNIVKEWSSKYSYKKRVVGDPAGPWSEWADVYNSEKNQIAFSISIISNDGKSSIVSYLAEGNIFTSIFINIPPTELYDSILHREFTTQ